MITVNAIYKEFRLLSRDLHGILVLFLMPMLFMLIMSAALSNDETQTNFNIALVGASNNALNQELSITLAQKNHLNITQIPLADLNTTVNDLHLGLYKMVLVNPNVEYALLANDSPIQLKVLADTDRNWMLGIKGLIQKAYTQQRIKHYFLKEEETRKAAIEKSLTNKRSKNQYNSNKSPAKSKQISFDATPMNQYLENDILEEQYINIKGITIKKPSSVQQSVPAWLIFGMFFIMIPLSNVMAVEKNTNTIMRLRLAKTSAFSLLFSKLVPYFFINQIQFIGMILLGIYILPMLGMTGFTLQGSYLNYALLSTAISLSALGYGLLISVLAKSTEHAVVLGGGGNIIMAAIGGIMVPRYVMPESMQSISQISPMSWALRAFHDLSLNQYNFEQILHSWLYLIGFASLFLSTACIIYFRQLRNL